VGQRQEINKQIKNVVRFYFRYYPKKKISNREIQIFEGYEEARIQYFAHGWKKKNNFETHIDRYSIKRSLRKQLREEILSYLKKRKIEITKDL